MDAGTRKKNQSNTNVCVTTPGYAALNEAFVDILQDKKNSIFVAVNAGLRQYHLENKYDAAYVINEAYLRASRAVARGQHPVNYPGWIRLTIRHIIQELSREAQKSRLTTNIIDYLPNPDSEEASREELTKQQQRIRKAFSALPKLDQDILQLKVVKGLRWADVQAALVDSGHPSMTVNHLSQKKRRILKKLRKAYEKPE